MFHDDAVKYAVEIATKELAAERDTLIAEVEQLKEVLRIRERDDEEDTLRQEIERLRAERDDLRALASVSPDPYTFLDLSRCPRISKMITGSRGHALAAAIKPREGRMPACSHPLNSRRGQRASRWHSHRG